MRFERLRRRASKHAAPAPMSRQSYVAALRARMEQMESVPTGSFMHSYAGEFDVRWERFLRLQCVRVAVPGALTVLLRALCCCVRRAVRFCKERTAAPCAKCRPSLRRAAV